MRKLLLCLLTLATLLPAQTLAPPSPLEPLAKSFRESPGPKTRAPLESFLLKHPKDADGALARLVLFNGDTSPAGQAALRAARPLLPLIPDYIDWMIASTDFAAKNYPSALANAEKVLSTPNTPLAPRAALLALKAAAELNDQANNKALLERTKPYLSPAQYAYYSGAHLDVWTKYPRSPEAFEAAKQLTLPSVPLDRRLERAFNLLEAGDASNARLELTALLPRLTGPALDLARVRIGIAEYRLRRDTALSSLRAAIPKDTAKDPSSEAERLFYLVLAAKRAKAYDTMAQAIDELNAKYPRSPFRLEALANAAGQFWVGGDNARSAPLYEACATDFAGEKLAEDCEWKVAIQHYILRKPTARAKLDSYLRLHPDGEHASAALYFLGRSHEAKPGDARRDPAAAKAYYTRAVELFPNHFYAELCRERLLQDTLKSATASGPITAALQQIRFPVTLLQLNFAANPDTTRRLARSELLARAALYDFAELEVRHEAKASPQSHLLAMAAARLANRRGAPDQGVRYMKSIFPSYLSLPLDQSNAPLWKLAFPLPYKDPLLTEAANYGVDPYLMAGLIRQESEFSAKVVSHANAHGLTQIMPATGAELARRLGLKGYTKAQLFNPAINLKMGTYYFKRLLDSLDGGLAKALASYNAGKGRVTEWTTRGDYEDPAEFIETIPFNETRNYVQSVIRNAGIYRRLYGQDKGIVVSKDE
jgi:soluble lytic murein transglycosylase